jgi:Holliday junction resolvase
MSLKGFLNRDKGQSRGYHRSKKQERTLSLRYKGSLVPGSGSARQKGDVMGCCGGVVRIEAKTTGAKSFSVTRDMVRKIEDAALPNNELPAIVIEFIDEFGKPVMEVAVVPTYALNLIGEAHAKS